MNTILGSRNTLYYDHNNIIIFLRSSDKLDSKPSNVLNSKASDVLLDTKSNIKLNIKNYYI